MKYSVGDLVFVIHSRINPFEHINGYKHFYYNDALRNTFGIITEVGIITAVDQMRAFEKNNVCIWYSQVDGTEYCFYEDEVIAEVIK